MENIWREKFIVIGIPFWLWQRSAFFNKIFTPLHSHFLIVNLSLGAALCVSTGRCSYLIPSSYHESMLDDGKNVKRPLKIATLNSLLLKREGSLQHAISDEVWCFVRSGEWRNLGRNLRNPVHRSRGREKMGSERRVVRCARYEISREFSKLVTTYFCQGLTTNPDGGNVEGSHSRLQLSDRCKKKDDSRVYTKI